MAYGVLDILYPSCYTIPCVCRLLIRIGHTKDVYEVEGQSTAAAVLRELTHLTGVKTHNKSLAVVSRNDEIVSSLD